MLVMSKSGTNPQIFRHMGFVPNPWCFLVQTVQLRDDLGKSAFLQALDSKKKNGPYIPEA